jgi:non-ribosomal peptide synthetase component F
MIGHYKNLLAAIVKTPKQKIGLLPMLSQEEQAQIIDTLSGKQSVYQPGKTIVSLFEEQVAATPNPPR